MDDARFDALAKALGQRPSRRRLLQGLLGLGGGAVAATVAARGAEAQWSVAVCLPDGAGGYTQRLVPKASVPLYVNRYGAVLPENGFCPGDCTTIECGVGCCEAGQDTCLSNGSCAQACSDTASCPSGCACSPPNIEGASYCVVHGAGCDAVGPVCKSTSQCDPGWHCQESGCGTPGNDRCIPLCGTPI